jgi:acetyl-CoA carboxylase carboxyl transferase subunit alpha
VISPEGAASILWRDSNKAEDAAVALKITAADLKQLKVIDEIIPEPVGGAHRDREHMMATTGRAIAAGLAEMKELGPEEIRRRRREKFLAIGRSL